MSDEMFSVELNKSFDVLSQKWESRIYFKIYLTMFKSGLVKELGSDRLAVLLTIASFMDESGSCYPTQEKIAEILGISRTSANKWINSLLEFRWNGRPVIERQKYRDPKVSPNEYSVYTILPLSQLAIFNGEVEVAELSDPGGVGAASLEVERKVTESRKELVSHFMNRYRETYSVNFGVSWGRDMKHAAKILAAYSPAEAMKIVDMVFEEYDQRWATREYNRPTLGQVASWLGAKAAELVKERETQIARADEPLHGGRSAADIMKMLGGGSA